MEMIAERLVRWHVGPGAEEEGLGGSRKGAGRESRGMVEGKDTVIELVLVEMLG